MESLIRKNIQQLIAYKVDAPQFEIVVNANESRLELSHAAQTKVLRRYL